MISVEKLESEQTIKEKIIPRLNIEDLGNCSYIKPKDMCPPDTIESLTLLSFKLKDRLTDYDTVLIDDGSGRLVGLYLLEQIKAQKRSKGILTETMAYGIVSGNNSNKQENAVINFVSDKNKKKNLEKLYS